MTVARTRILSRLFRRHRTFQHRRSASLAVFELNGQPRTIRVPNRLVKSQTAQRPKAEQGNPDHIGAPMPGVVASVAVSVGQAVKEGDMLLTIEAMKMETGIHAERDATVKAVHVHAGGQIDAKDLMIELE